MKHKEIRYIDHIALQQELGFYGLCDKMSERERLSLMEKVDRMRDVKTDDLIGLAEDVMEGSTNPDGFDVETIAFIISHAMRSSFREV